MIVGANKKTHLVCVPQLANDEQLLPLDKSFIQSSSKTFTGFLFVSVIATGIEHSNTSFDGLVDGVGTDFIRHFPHSLLHTCDSQLR